MSVQEKSKTGLAPIAAKSLRFVAIALYAKFWGEMEDKKCVPLNHCIGGNRKLIAFWNMSDRTIIPNTEINKVLIAFLY